MVREMVSGFVWLELRTNDVAKAKKFYQGLFDWKLEEMPMGDGAYIMVKGAGVDKEFGAGMMKNPAPPSIPSHWTPFVRVKDVADATKKAERLGAEIAQKPMETPFGIMSTIIDPTGAIISLWQPKSEK
jgi:predicted enzyme related to lactoylglutathione lyase